MNTQEFTEIRKMVFSNIYKCFQRIDENTPILMIL